MKRKSSTTPDVSDEEECKNMLPAFDNPERKEVESMKGTSSNTSFDFGEFDKKLASIHIPKAEETIKGKSSSTLSGPEGEISDFTFYEPKGVESIEGKSGSTFFSSEGKISDFTFIRPKAEPIEGKLSPTFFGFEGKIPDSTFFESKAIEYTKGQSSSNLGPEVKTSDSTFFQPKEESLEEISSFTFFGSGGKDPNSSFIEPKSVESGKGKSSSTFLDSEGKSPDYTVSEPEGVETMKEKSSSNSGGSYDVVLDIDNKQANEKGLKFIERLHQIMGRFQIDVLKPDKDVLEVGVTGKVFIPVFSKSFASNEACLQNLVSMVDCRNYSVTNHIMPIYFGIDPSDVGLDTSLYREDLDKPRRSVDDKIVNRWTEALIDVSNISGWLIPETTGPDGIDYLMNEVCQMVLHKLNPSLLSRGTNLVGINEQVKRITEKLNLGVNDIEVISITGEDGLGKTTVARAVYNKLSPSFEACSFIAGIEEMHWIYDGIENLQAKLVSDLLSREVEVFESEDEGRDLIRERFCHMKVLIVLDDVCRRDDAEPLLGQLNWLGPGSRIIITRPNAQAGHIPFSHSIYKLPSHRQRLSDKQVIDLFNYHAFPKGYPFPDFHDLSMELSKEITRHRDFSYLDIEILGSLLYGKSKAEWESMLLHLKQLDSWYLSNRREMLLRMSYDSLTESQKEIFLDISCLPAGMNRRIASLLCDDYSLHSQSSENFEVLIRLSLVKIDTNDGIWMRRFVRIFGRGIMDDTQHYWRRNKTGNMRIFKMARGRMSPFGIVRARAHQRGLICDSLFPELGGAHDHGKRLKILDLSGSKITEKWETWHQIKAPQLRVLNLTGCVDLMVTPNFSFCPDLEMLILEHCSQLVKIDPSIQGLQRLVTLNLRYCTELSVLPKEIGYLNALKELLMDGTSIQEIPLTIGHLKKLQVLTAFNCSSLTQLPNSMSNLLFISTLRLDCAKIAELPYSILCRLKLQYLSLRDCRRITNLGPFVGELEISLIELDISGTSISKLSKSLSKLKNLRVLKVNFCFIREFPPGFGQLKKLEEVQASWCKGLEELPHDIGGVASLRILKVAHSRISSLPQSIQLLEHLESLDCTSCNNLQGLPKLPSSLTCLNVQSKKLKVCPNLYNLVNLEEFTLGVDASHTTRLLSFPPFLRKLTLQCSSLEHVAAFPSTLVVIKIRNVRFLKELPNVESLQNLLEIEVVCCPAIKKIEGLEKLKALQLLTLSNCGIESLDGIGELLSLRKLTLQNCRSLSKLPNLKRLKNLLEMKIIGSSEIKRVVGLGGLQRLQVLNISDCGIGSVIGLDKLRSLRRLTITGCGSLRQVPDLSNLMSLDEKCVLQEDPE